MIPGAAIYTQRRKARHFTEAMLAGFPAKECASESGRLDPEAQLHVLGGLQFGCLELMQQICSDRLQFVFWDRAYFGGGTNTDRLRITLNHYQKDWIETGRSLERFERFGGRLQPWRKGGRHILVVPPSDAIMAMWSPRSKGGGAQIWLDGVLRDLRAATERPIDVSWKGDKRPLEQRLQDCHAVVTCSSNVAVEAICAGVPAYCNRWSAALPVSGNVVGIHNPPQIEFPPLPDREAWAASLGWGQFTNDEIRSGFARAVVLGDA